MAWEGQLYLNSLPRLDTPSGSSKTMTTWGFVTHPSHVYRFHCSYMYNLKFLRPNNILLKTEAPLCSFLCHLAKPYVSGLNFLLSTLFSKTLSVCSLCNLERQFRTHRKEHESRDGVGLCLDSPRFES
jgi:hypothetical protein